jgi:hypothetical protein
MIIHNELKIFLNRILPSYVNKKIDEEIKKLELKQNNKQLELRR